MPVIKAVLFDMDGVLIDAKDWHYDALNRALRLFGYEISRESHLSTFDGLPTRRKLQMLTDAYSLPAGLHEFLNNLKQSYTQELSATSCKPTFNHQYALSRLKADGLKLAVCSNSVRRSVETMMKLSNLDGYLDMLVSNEDVANPKPHPDMYLKAIKGFGLSPDECLILEDNDHGIEAAHASGAHVLEVGVPGDVTYEQISGRIADIEFPRQTVKSEIAR